MKNSDSIINLVVHGVIPSKKNAKRPFVRNGRMMIFSSKSYVEWNKTAVLEVKSALQRAEPLEVVSSIVLTFYAQTRRLYDLSNKAESVMDTLVDAGILKDDNYSVVPELILKHGGHDKENPRCEITIYEKAQA